MGSPSYKPTKIERGQIERELKRAALKGEPSALLAYSNIQLAEAIKAQGNKNAAAA